MKTTIFTIGQICQRFSSGKNITSENIYVEGDFPVYGGNGLRGYAQTSNFEGECSIIGRQGAYCGNVRYFKGKGYMSDHAIVAVTTSEHNNRFFSYKLGLANLGRFSGQAAQPGLSVTKLSRLRLEMPDLAVQNKIASILATYDDLIEKNNRKIAILQEMSEEIYKEWFVRFRFPGYKTTKFHKGIPEGWEYGTIKDLGSFVRGKNITADEMEEGDIPVISAGIEPSGFHNESNVQGISLTISSSGANAGFLRINYSDIWAADCSFLNDLENIFYMYELLNNMRPCIDNLQRGAAQPHVYPKDINKLKIVLPPIQLRTKFNEIAKQVHLTIATLQKQNKNLTQQRDLLLPRLMSGKLEVKA